MFDLYYFSLSDLDPEIRMGIAVFDRKKCQRFGAFRLEQLHADISKERVTTPFMLGSRKIKIGTAAHSTIVKPQYPLINVLELH